MARPKSDISARIARAARDQFLMHGVDGASLRAIAAKAKTSIGMVYYYFPAKDDLFVAVVEAVYTRLLSDLAEALREDAPGETSIAGKLRRLYSRIWQMSDDEYATVRLVMREAMVSGDRVRRLSPLFAQGHVRLLLSALHQGVGEGALRDDVPPVAQLVVTMALGLMPMLAWRVAGQRVMPDFPLPSPEALGEIFSSIWMGGLGAQNAATPSVINQRTTSKTASARSSRMKPKAPTSPKSRSTRVR